MTYDENALELRDTRAIDTCTSCPKLCRWACPVAEAEARETTSPWSLMTMAGLQKKGLGPNSGLLAFRCTHCGACTQACLHKNDVPLSMSLARARALAKHSAPDAVAEIRGRFGVAQNAYGWSLLPKLEDVAGRAKTAIRPASGAKKNLYLPGCSALVDRPSAATAFLEATAMHGIDDVALTEISAECCGLPLLWAGDLDAFWAHATGFAQRIASFEQVLVHDAACGHALRVRYPDFGVTVGPKVTHVLSFLASRLDIRVQEGHAETSPLLLDGPYTDKATPRLAYLDGCHLSRGMGQVALPRKLARQAAGEAIAEVRGSRGVAADCCGAAGLLPETAPATARLMGQARIDAFLETRAQTLVVATPRCAAHLRRIDPQIDIVDPCELWLRSASR